ADAVLVARPYVTAVYGAAEEGVQVLTDKLAAELADAMKMCGVSKLSDISKKHLFAPKSSFFRM
ncbi:MAG: alpha-hydroxy-acid oxidizing protein, partial [Lachnospiraceae bacterium]|nr:alpha-hydroxy-acid oxidizing protein [Lachnospiraceae bacterium]